MSRGDSFYAPISAGNPDPTKRYVDFGTNNSLGKTSWLINFLELTIEKELGSGSYGLVYKALW